MKQKLFYRLSEFTRTQTIFALAVFAVYCYLRFRYRFRPELFSDEFFTITGFQRSFMDYLFQYLPRNEFHYPPNFLLLYPIGHWVTDNRFVIMLPHLIGMVIFFCLLIQVNWQSVLHLKVHFLDPKWINLIAAAMITFNETQILHALILRPYALLSLLALISLVLAYHIMNAKRFKLWLSISVFGFLIFHNYCLLMMAIALFYMGMSSFDSFSFQAFGQFFKEHKSGFCMAIMGLVLALPILYYYHQSPALKPDYLAGSQIDPHEYIKSGLKGWIQVVAINFGFRPFRLMLLFFAMLGTFLWIARKQWKPLFFLALWVIIPIILIYTVDVRMKYWFIQRQFLWVMPFHAVYVAAAVLCALDCLISFLGGRQHEK